MVSIGGKGANWDDVQQKTEKTSWCSICRYVNSCISSKSCSTCEEGHLVVENCLCIRLAVNCVTKPYVANFYRATACNATHGIVVAILSVCPSVRRVYCDKTKWRTEDILIPHDTVITLVFWHQQRLWAMPLPSEICAQMTHLLRKTPTSIDFRS